MEIAVERGVDADAAGVLVDEQFGSRHPEARARARPQARHAGREVRPERVRLPVRRGLRRSTSRQSTRSSRRCSCVYNPDGDAEMNERQLGRLKRARRLAARERPPVPVRAARAGRGRPARLGRRRHRPLRRRAAPGADAARDRADPGLRHRGRHLEDRGRRRARGRRDAGPSRPARARGARTSPACCWAAARRDEKVDHWLQQAAPVEGFIGFAIGRSIWWDALKGFLDGEPRARARPPSRSPTTTCASSRSTTTRSRRRASSSCRNCNSPPAATGRPASVGRRCRASRLILVPGGARRRGLHRGREVARAGRRRRPVVRRADGCCASSTATRSTCSVGGQRRERPLHRRRHAGVGQARHAGAVLRQARERVQRAAGGRRAGAAGARRRARATATGGCWLTSTASATACSSTPRWCAAATPSR